MKRNTSLVSLFISFLSLANTSTTIEQLNQNRVTCDKKQVLLQTPKITNVSIKENSIAPSNTKHIQGDAQFLLQSIIVRG